MASKRTEEELLEIYRGCILRMKGKIKTEGVHEFLKQKGYVTPSGTWFNMQRNHVFMNELDYYNKHGKFKTRKADAGKKAEAVEVVEIETVPEIRQEIREEVKPAPEGMIVSLGDVMKAPKKKLEVVTKITMSEGCMWFNSTTGKIRYRRSDHSAGLEFGSLEEAEEFVAMFDEALEVIGGLV